MKGMPPRTGGPRGIFCATGPLGIGGLCAGIAAGMFSSVLGFEAGRGCLISLVFMCA